MRLDGSSLPPSPGSSWGAVLWLLLFCALLCLATLARGQELTGSGSKLTSIEASLIGSLSASAELRQALREQRASRLDLEIAYSALKVQLQTSDAKLQSRIDELGRLLLNSVTLSDDLLAEIRRLTTLSTALRQESEALSRAFDDYRAEMQVQVKGLECQVRGWKIIAICAGVVAVGFTVYAVLK